MFHVILHSSSGTGGQLYGIVVISGTGMISYGYANGQSARAGGWGPALGDCGSGHDIGFEVLRAVVRSKVLAYLFSFVSFLLLY